MIFNQILRLYHLLSTIFSRFFRFPLLRTKTVEIQTMASPPVPDNWRDILEDRSPPTAATTSRVPAPPPPPRPPAPAPTPAPAPAPAPAHAPARAQVVALSNTTVSIKLDENNYLIWRQQVEAVINGHNLDRFLMDPVFPHRFRNRDAGNFNEDRSLEQLLFVWLLSTLSEPIGTRFVGCGNCAELWDEIEKFFKARARAKVTQFRIELDNMKKGTEESISEYLLRIKVLIDSLDFADCRLSMREHVDIILDGLPEEYDAFVTAVNVGLTRSNVHQIEPLLLVHEAWLERKKKKKIKQSVQSPVPQSPVRRMSCNTTESVFLPNQFEFDLRPMQYHPQQQGEIGNQFPLQQQQQQQSSMLQMPWTSVPPPPAWTSPPTLSAFSAPMPMRPSPPGFAPLPRRPNVSYYGPH